MDEFDATLQTQQIEKPVLAIWIWGFETFD